MRSKVPEGFPRLSSREKDPTIREKQRFYQKKHGKECVGYQRRVELEGIQ